MEMEIFLCSNFFFFLKLPLTVVLLISGEVPDGRWPDVLFLHVYDDQIGALLKVGGAEGRFGI